MARLIRAISENGGVVFSAIDSTAIVSEMEKIHQTSAVTSAALGRLLTAGALMGAMLKSPENSITLRVQGGGPAGLLLVVADGAGHVKGMVEYPVVEIPLRQDGKLDVGFAVGSNGTLSVVRDLGMKEPYIGQVPLVSGGIAEDITSYYAVSEQIPTVCALGVLVAPDLTIRRAGGFLIQLLPGAQESEIDRLEANIGALKSVTQMLEEGMTLEDMMRLALDGFEPQILDEQECSYFCDCSTARMERALISLGRDQLEEMAREDETAEMHCQFCGRRHRVNLNELLRQMSAHQAAADT